MHYEVEQKYCTPSHTDVQTHLDRLGAKPLSPVSQRDTYYAHPQRDFAITDEALRIRQVGGQACITYKGPKIDLTTKTRRELEIFLAEGIEGADQLDAMLLALGFRHVGMVCKSRQAYHLQREGQKVEVALDDVEGLGCFAELEILVTTSEGVQQAQQTIAYLATELDLSEVQRRSYLELLLRC